MRTTDVSVQLRDRVAIVPCDVLTAVAPVTALLLQSVHLRVKHINEDNRHNTHATILDRVLGDAPELRPSNNITSILSDLIEPIDQPIGQAICQWIHLSTGQATTFRLQHAVNYAFAIDGGNHHPSVSVASLGTSFCLEPQDHADLLTNRISARPSIQDTN